MGDIKYENDSGFRLREAGGTDLPRPLRADHQEYYKRNGNLIFLGRKDCKKFMSRERQ